MANNRILRAYELIGDVEERKLDRQQMACIVKEAHNHLVIAGAGTGKTTTVVGKIKYLLKSEKFRPEDILVLSFTNASATEMCQRIRLETGVDIDVSTFHKLGLNIISEVDVFEVASEVAALTHGHELGWLSSGMAAYIINQVAYKKVTVEEATRSAIGFVKEHYSDRKHLEELISIVCCGKS